MTTDIAELQRLPEYEGSAGGVHVAWSCAVTCPRFTSDSIPTICGWKPA